MISESGLNTSLRGLPLSSPDVLGKPPQQRLGGHPGVPGEHLFGKGHNQLGRSLEPDVGVVSGDAEIPGGVKDSDG
jgi:hypothetical protein